MLKALAALTTASLVLAAPAAAQLERYSNSDLLNRGVHPEIVQGFDALSVPVFNGSTVGVCQMTETVRPVAFYNYKYNAILVCQQNVKSGDEFISSVTHEAVHMVQDCRNGLESNTLQQAEDTYLGELFDRLHPDLQDNIIAVYEPGDYAVEIEAFYFQSRPAAVADGIQTFCF